MRLERGMKAPDFSVEDTTGKRHTLDGYRGKRLMVSFFRYAACPYCNLAIQALSRRYADWETQGLTILAFFQSDDERVERIVGKQGVPFPLVGEPERAVYQSYGVESSMLGFLVGFVHPKSLVALGKGFMPGKMEGDKALLPADFLIGPDGKIEDVFYASNISQHMPLERVEAFVNGDL